MQTSVLSEMRQRVFTYECYDHITDTFIRHNRKATEGYIASTGVCRPYGESELVSSSQLDGDGRLKSKA